MDQLRSIPDVVQGGGDKDNDNKRKLSGDELDSAPPKASPAAGPAGNNGTDSVRTVTELIQGEYGMKEIRRYGRRREAEEAEKEAEMEKKKTTVRPARKPRTLVDELREEFEDLNDPSMLTALGKLDLVDRLEVAVPACRKADKKRAKLPRAFYFWHLSPFARDSIMEVYYFSPQKIEEYETRKRSCDSTSTTSQGALAIPPRSRRNRTCQQSRECTQSGNVSRAPVRGSVVFDTHSHTEFHQSQQATHTVDHIEEVEEPDESMSHPPKADLGAPQSVSEPEESKISVPAETHSTGHAPPQDTIELGEEGVQMPGTATMNDTEKNEIRQISNAIVGTIPAEEETTEASIRSLLTKAEDLIKVLQTLDGKEKDQHLQLEIARRLQENMGEMLRALQRYDHLHPLEERLLMRITEIAKSYADEGLRTKIMRVALEEYRRTQEQKVEALKQEKKTVEAAEVFDRQYKMLKELVQLFPTGEQAATEPEQHEREKTSDSPKSRGSGKLKYSTAMPPAVHRSRAKQSAGPPKQKPTQETSRMRRGFDIKHTNPGASSRTLSMRGSHKGLVAADDTKAKRTGKNGKLEGKKQAEKDDEEWIGQKSMELEDDSLWQYDANEL